MPYFKSMQPTPSVKGVFVVRSPIGDQHYYDHWVKVRMAGIQERLGMIKMLEGNPAFRPQYVFDLSQEYLHLMLLRYSRGDSRYEISRHFDSLLGSWELSNRLAQLLSVKQNTPSSRDWRFTLTDLNHYIFCFWLVGLAMAFEIPYLQWRRLLTLIGDEGQDVLLDSVIAVQEPNRKIGEQLCHPLPYARLLNVLHAPQVEKSALLKDFVAHWYDHLDRVQQEQDDPIHFRPYWYSFGDANFEDGSYFGRWCIEAVAVAKAFHIDDTPCHEHEHYPAGLLNPAL